MAKSVIWLVAWVGITPALSPVAAASPPHEVQWLWHIDTDQDDSFSDIALSPAGEAYVVGRTGGDSWVANTSGEGNYLFAKFDAQGIPLWGRRLGPDPVTSANAVAVDSGGGVYLGGYSFIEGGSGDALIAKFDQQGSPIWSHSIDSGEWESISHLAVDNSQNAYALGKTDGPLYGDDPAEVGLFLAKFDPAGSEVWGRQVPIDSADRLVDLAVNGGGAAFVYLAHPVLEFNGPFEASLLKFSSQGDLEWSRTINPDQRRLGSVAAGADGAVYVTDSVYVPGESYDDWESIAMLTKLDANGEELWSRQIGSGPVDYADQLSLDAAGNVFVTWYNDLSAYAAGSGGFPLPNQDLYLGAYASDGEEIWTREVEYRSLDRYAPPAHKLSVDPAGGILLSGSTSDYIPGEGGFRTPRWDPYLIRLQSPVPEPGAAALLLFAAGSGLLARRPARCLSPGRS